MLLVGARLSTMNVSAGTEPPFKAQVEQPVVHLHLLFSNLFQGAWSFAASLKGSCLSSFQLSAMQLTG